MPLFLSHLTLSHFRSHKTARIDADARPVAIHGPNGSGKTNILEAVSLLSPGRGLRRANAQEMARQPEALGWKVHGILQLDGQMHEIETASEGGARSVRIGGKNTSQTELGRIGRVLWLVPAMDRLWIEGAEGRRRFLDRMTLSFEPGHARASLDYEKAMRERNRLLKDQVRDDHWYAALEQSMARAGTEIHANRKAALVALAAAQEHASTSFPAAELALVHTDTPLPENEAELLAALAESRARDILAGRTLVGPHRADLEAVYTSKGVAARHCSTGEQKALLISLVLANARALMASLGTAPILLLDEVSAHLDPDRRAALFDALCALGTQAWMTGTEPELFSGLGERGQYLEIEERDGVSMVKHP